MEFLSSVCTASYRQSQNYDVRFWIWRLPECYCLSLKKLRTFFSSAIVLHLLWVWKLLGNPLRDAAEGWGEIGAMVVKSKVPITYELSSRQLIWPEPPDSGSSPPWHQEANSNMFLETAPKAQEQTQVTFLLPAYMCLCLVLDLGEITKGEKRKEETTSPLVNFLSLSLLNTLNETHKWLHFYNVIFVLKDWRLEDLTWQLSVQPSQDSHYLSVKPSGL